MAHMDLKKLAAVGALLAACGTAQTTFTVSSVKPSRSGRGKGDLSTSPVMLTIRNLPLDLIIAAAYGIAGYQISGPEWLRDERFDIIAKTDAPVASEDEMRRLLQALLAERFRASAASRNQGTSRLRTDGCQEWPVEKGQQDQRNEHRCRAFDHAA